jgi:leader peptidase (prepilin peptidase)/N-methyltransferase
MGWLAPPFLAMLAVCTWVDARSRVVPDLAVAGGATTALVCSAIVAPETLVERLAAGLGAGAFLLLAALLRRGGLGLGDVKLGTAMGCYLGVSVAPALLAAFAAGSALALALIARHGLDARRRTIAFAPCMAVGGILALVAGPDLVDWYLRRL